MKKRWVVEEEEEEEGRKRRGEIRGEDLMCFL
jgi:hypothetical protein